MEIDPLPDVAESLIILQTKQDIRSSVTNRQQQQHIIRSKVYRENYIELSLN